MELQLQAGSYRLTACYLVQRKALTSIESAVFPTHLYEGSDGNAVEQRAQLVQEAVRICQRVLLYPAQEACHTHCDHQLGCTAKWGL